MKRIKGHLPDPGLKLVILLFFTSMIAVSLVLLREHITGNRTYLFLIWNLFLAWVPFVISSFLKYTNTTERKWYYNIALLLCWLVFFPNAPYILTDLVHLKLRPDIAYWYDFVILLFFCFNSLFLAFASLIQIKRVNDLFIPKWLSHLSVMAILILTSFGIYLGRFERLNSWDILTNPGKVVMDIYQLISNTGNDRQFIYVVFFLSLFLIINYFTLILLHKVIQHTEQVANKSHEND